MWKGGKFYENVIFQTTLSPVAASIGTRTSSAAWPWTLMAWSLLGVLRRCCKKQFSEKLKSSEFSHPGSCELVLSPVRRWCGWRALHHPARLNQAQGNQGVWRTRQGAEVAEACGGIVVTRCMTCVSWSQDKRWRQGLLSSSSLCSWWLDSRTVWTWWGPSCSCSTGSTRSRRTWL